MRAQPSLSGPKKKGTHICDISHDWTGSHEHIHVKTEKRDSNPGVTQIFASIFMGAHPHYHRTRDEVLKFFLRWKGLCQLIHTRIDKIGSCQNSLMDILTSPKSCKTQDRNKDSILTVFAG